MRWPWETSQDYKRRLDARTARVEARQQGRTDRIAAKASGGYYDPASVAARQGTVQSTVDAGLTAAEGIAQAFGYDVELDGESGRAAPTGTMTTTATTSSSGMDQQTMMILAALALGGVLLLSSRK
jgi:hypothetical protein